MATGSPISLVEIIVEVLKEIPRMAKENQPRYGFGLRRVGASKRDRIEIDIELSKNNLKPEFYDASVVVSRFCHTIENTDHVIKFSIFASKCCLIKGRLNKKAPDRTLELESIVPKKGKPFLDFPKISSVEKSLTIEACTHWDKKIR